MKVYGKIIGVLIGAFFVSQFLSRTLFLNASPRINPEFLAQLPQNVGNFLASPLGNNSATGMETGTENETCVDPTGNETYYGIRRIGPHVAGNTNPANYKQVRKLYNCENKGNSAVTNSYIPVTIVYDLLFLKGSVSGIQANLAEMKKYGLFPLIRVSSYTDGSGTWIKIGQEDAKIMGQHLAQALNAAGFPDNPPVTYLNEVNLNIEWGGQTNPAEIASSFASFVDGMGQGQFRLFFPALSYGATSAIGMTPTDFINGFFAAPGFSGKKIHGASLNIYGPDYSSIQTQYTNQSGAFNQYASYFYGAPGMIISELGPTDTQSIIYNCADPGPWPSVAGPILFGFNSNPVALYATTTCFQGNKIYLTVIHADGSNPRLLLFELYGGAGNQGPTDPPRNNPTATTVPGQPTSPPANPTDPPGVNPTTPPANTVSSVKVVVHMDSTSGALWNKESGSVSVYLEGPTAKGRFGETLSVFGTNKNSCTSNGGFPYTCTIGTAEWKGADGKSGTSSGDYTVFIRSVPDGWSVVEGAKSAQGTLSAGQTLTLDLAIKK